MSETRPGGAKHRRQEGAVKSPQRRRFLAGLASLACAVTTAGKAGEECRPLSTHEAEYYRRDDLAG